MNTTRLQLSEDLWRRLTPYLSLLALMVILSILSPHFLGVENLFAIGLQMSVVAIMAVGQVMVIISGGIDLSVGSLLAFTGVLSTITLTKGMPIGVALGVGVAAGGLAGWANGVLITKARIPPFIATLGMMGIARGLALIITGGVPIFGLPESFAYLGSGRILGVAPVPVVLTVIVALWGHALLTRTRLGRHFFAIGGNRDAAHLSGVHVDRSLQWVYTISGLLSGLAGVVLASRLSTGQPTAGTGYELDVIAACVIGGASLSGGLGTVSGTIVGALIMGMLRNGCNLLDISAFWQQVAIGSVIIVAVFYDQYRNRSN